MKRYALLDTDFISKTHSVQDDGGNHLIDRVMELPEYEFFCHAQIVTELNRYNADTPIWLSEKIGAQKIKSYTDQEILESLSLVRGPLACATYTQMLKLACDAFSKDYFSEHYRALTREMLSTSWLDYKTIASILATIGYSWASKFIRGGEKNAVKYADEVIVLSKGVQKYFMDTYGRETHFIRDVLYIR